MILNAIYVRNFLSLNMLVHMSVCHELLEELIETIVNQDCEHENYFKCYLCEKLFKSQYTGSYECVCGGRCKVSNWRS